MNYSVIGINSGLGVSLFPFKSHVIANLETRGVFHTPNNEQWKSNFGDIPLYKNSNSFPKISADIVISSPDCGSGSVFRLSRAKKFGDHKKNDSLSEFIVGVRLVNAKFFLFENLENLFKSFPKDEFKAQLDNYNLIIHNDSVSKWGNSQKTRKRLVIVGIRKDLPFDKLKKYFKIPHYEDRIKTCKELYGDLSSTEVSGKIREALNDVISIHARRRMSLKEIKSEWNDRLKNKKRWIVQGGNFSTAPGVYRNLDDDFPATARKANRQFDEKGLTLTPRHLARIQGVPDNFVIYSDEKKQKTYWINKGRTVVTKTPPMEISKWFKNKLEKSYNLWKS